jgi:hypothetical protein
VIEGMHAYHVLSHLSLKFQEVNTFFKLIHQNKAFLLKKMAQRGGNIRDHKPVSFGELQKIVAEKSVARVGATENPQQRADQYAREGYSGQMYQFRTQNMQRAEDRLLQQGGGTHNVQERSNAPDKPGYVYALKGRKYN